MTVPSNFELAQTGLKNKYETGFKLASHALWVTFITTKLPLDLIKENCILYKRAFGYTASAKPLTEPKEKVNIKYFFRQFSSSGQMKKLKEFADLAYKEKMGESELPIYELSGIIWKNLCLMNFGYEIYCIWL